MGTNESDADDGAKVLKSHGHIKFDNMTSDGFRDLVQQTLNESAYIEVTEADGGVADFVINEIENADPAEEL